MLVPVLLPTQNWINFQNSPAFVAQRAASGERRAARPSRAGPLTLEAASRTWLLAPRHDSRASLIVSGAEAPLERHSDWMGQKWSQLSRQTSGRGLFNGRKHSLAGARGGRPESVRARPLDRSARQLPARRSRLRGGPAGGGGERAAPATPSGQGGAIWPEATGCAAAQAHPAAARAAGDVRACVRHTETRTRRRSHANRSLARWFVALAYMEGSPFAEAARAAPVTASLSPAGWLAGGRLSGKPVSKRRPSCERRGRRGSESAISSDMSSARPSSARRAR